MILRVKMMPFPDSREGCTVGGLGSLAHTNSISYCHQQLTKFTVSKKLFNTYYGWNMWQGWWGSKGIKQFLSSMKWQPSWRDHAKVHEKVKQQKQTKDCSMCFNIHMSCNVQALSTKEGTTTVLQGSQEGSLRKRRNKTLKELWGRKGRAFYGETFQRANPVISLIARKNVILVNFMLRVFYHN